MKRITAPVLGLFVLAMGATAGCTSSTSGGTSGGGGINTNVVYDPPAHLDHWVYQIVRADGKVTTLTARVAGVKTIGGQDYARLQLGKLPTSDKDPAARYVEIWAQPQGTAVIVAGGEAHLAALGLPAGTPDLTVTLNPPGKVETDIAVDAPHNVSTTVTYVLGDPASGQPTTEATTGTFKLVSKAETVQTGLGTQTAAHYTGSALALGEVATGDIWTVSGTGVVKISGSWPGMPGKEKTMGLDLAGTAGSMMDGDHTVASKESVLATTNSIFSLDTYDLEGGIFADKMTHANLLMEVRWADAAKAKTAEQPSVQLNFGTAMGYFPTTTVDSPVSILHPEENGKGYHFWTTLVNQAAKNEPGGNETTYHMKATYQGSAAVRVTGQLNWHSLKPK